MTPIESGRILSRYSEEYLKPATIVPWDEFFYSDNIVVTDIIARLDPVAVEWLNVNDVNFKPYIKVVQCNPIQPVGFSDPLLINSYNVKFELVYGIDDTNKALLFKMIFGGK